MNPKTSRDALLELCALTSLVTANTSPMTRPDRLMVCAALITARHAWGAGPGGLIEPLRRELLVQVKQQVLTAERAATILDALAAGQPLPPMDRVSTERLCVLLMQARRYDDAAALAGSSRSLRALAKTGIAGTPSGRFFIADPRDAARFPASLPMLQRCVQSWLGPAPRTGSLQGLWRIRQQLERKHRGRADALLSLVQWREHGLEAAREAISRIQSQHEQQRAMRLLVILAEHEQHGPTISQLTPKLLRPITSKEIRHSTWLPPGNIRHRITTLADWPGHSPTRNGLARWLSYPGNAPDVMRLLEGRELGMARQLENLSQRWGQLKRVWASCLLQRILQLEVMARHARPDTSGFTAGLLGRPPKHTDGRSLRRSCYDEGASLRPSSSRRALQRASLAVLRSDLTTPLPRAVRSARLRTLVHIGGGMARDALTALVLEAPSGHPLSQQSAVALARLDPAQTLQWLAPRVLTLSPPTLYLLLACLETAGLVISGTTAALRSLRAAAKSSVKSSANSELLDSLIVNWRQQSVGLPTPSVLAGLEQELRHPSGPGTLRERLEGALEVALKQPPDVLIARLQGSALLRERLRWTRHGAMPRLWGDVQLRQDLEDIVGLGEVDPGTVETLLACLPGARRAELRHHLLLGRSPGDAVTPVGEGYRLRHLDKRADLLTMLRFADAAPCCWSSSSGNRIRKLRLMVWRDPLSFCFLIERQEEASWLPRGFVFGSYAVDETTPQALLNGVYLHRQQDNLRDAVLRGLEGFFGGLGVSALGIACRHGGRGTMPERWQEQTRSTIRLRAVRSGGRLVTQTSDDIGTVVNQPMSPRLYWRDLVG